MQLNDLADIWQGNIYTRIKPTGKEGENVLTCKAVTMQELSDYDGFISTAKEEVKEIKISAGKKRILITKENDVLVGLASRNAMVINKATADRIVLSNFALIRIKDFKMLNPYYLCWLFNCNLHFQRMLENLAQGSTAISILLVESLRKVDIKLIPLPDQKKIGNVYNLARNRKRIALRIEREREKYINHKLMLFYNKTEEVDDDGFI